MKTSGAMASSGTRPVSPGVRSTRFLHDCRRTAARNLIRASVPDRVAMLLTGHKSRAIFDRYNIINEQELLGAGDQLVTYLAQHAQATPRGGRPHPTPYGARKRPRRVNPRDNVDRRPRPPARPVAGHPRSRLLLRLAQA